MKSHQKNMCFDPFLYWLQVRSTNFCDRNQFLELRALDVTIAHEEFRCLQFELLPPGTNDNSPFIEERLEAEYCRLYRFFISALRRTKTFVKTDQILSVASSPPISKRQQFFRPPIPVDGE